MADDFLVDIDAEFWPCPDCRTPLVLVNGQIPADLVLELHERLTPTGVAPMRATLHARDCTTRNHLAEPGSPDWRTFRPRGSKPPADGEGRPTE